MKVESSSRRKPGVRQFASTAVGWAVLVMLCLASPSAAQETAPYPNGTSGLLAGTVPPPGYYWLMYNRLYTADLVRGASDEPASDISLSAFANVHRFINVTEYKLWGADYAWNCVVPLVAIDVNIADFGVSDSAFSVGDLNLEPFVIEWHQPRYDIGFVYGLFVPVAHRDDSRPALPGKNFWTHYVGAAGTYYFDEQRTWAASFLSRYEISSSRRDLDVRPGDNFSFEWGLSKALDETTLAGVSGYGSWQTTFETGADSTAPDARNRVFGIGPEVQYFSPRYKLGFHFRYWWEFAAEHRTEGRIATITLVKPF